MDIQVTRLAVTTIPTRFGRFQTIAFRSSDAEEHLALVAGQVEHRRGVLTRVHSECLTGDALYSLRCDCGLQLRFALEQIAAATGVVIYMGGHEGRGIGLLAKLKAYALQDIGLDTIDANLRLGLPVDARSYVAAAAILRDLQVDSIRLLSNNPTKVQELDRAGVRVLERISIPTEVAPAAVRYLQTKRDRMGHCLPHVPDTTN